MPVFLSGWKPSLPDARDFRYSAPSHILKALPPKFDLVDPLPGPPFSPVFSQGEIGSCGPQTLCANLIFDWIATGDKTLEMPSRNFVYYNTRERMGTALSDSGVDNRTLIKAVKEEGWCDEILWPYGKNNLFSKPPSLCYDQSKALKRGANIVYQSVPQDLDSMKACLVELKRPFVFGFSVYQSMMTAEVARTGIVPDPQGFMDRLLGGHDVLIVGYDDATRHWKFRNSWGEEWGNPGGYGQISFKFSMNWAGDFWVIVKAPDGTNNPEPIPDTPPTPPGPSPLKEWLDAIFVALAAQFKDKPILVGIIQLVQRLVDAYLSHNQMAGLVVDSEHLKSIVESLLKILENQLMDKPSDLMAVRVVHQMVDQQLEK